MSRTLRRICVLALTTSVGSVILTTSAYANGVTTSSALTIARDTIAKQDGVQVDFVGHSGTSSTTEKIIANVGTNTGSETIFEGTADLALRVTPTVAYVSGDSSGLTTLFGMTAADAKKLGTHWESWKASTKQYSNLKSDVTMTSVTALLPKVTGTKLSVTGSGDATHYVFKWSTAASGSVPKLSNTLIVSGGSDRLPISETTSASGGTKITTTLSKWNEPIVVNAPPAGSTVDSSHI